MRPFMLNLNIDTEVKDVIDPKVLEEKFSAGLMEFEALMQSISQDSKSKLIDLLEEYS
jgi:hypothetical protein